MTDNKTALEELSKAEFHRAEPEVGILEDGYYLGGLTPTTMETIRAALSRTAPVDIQSLKQEVANHLSTLNDGYGWEEAVEYLAGRYIERLINPAQGVVDGYKLVPVEPTEEMCLSGEACEGNSGCKEGSTDDCNKFYEMWKPENVELIYKAMLAAAPQPKDAVSQWRGMDALGKIKIALEYGENPFMDGKDTYLMYERNRKKAIGDALAAIQPLPAPPVEEEKEG